jgi:poly(A) polymerase Pap1
MPVQLAELGKNASHTTERTLGWRADKEMQQKGQIFGRKVKDGFASLSMPIITPGLPERNVAFNVNHSTALIIRQQLKQGDFIYCIAIIDINNI